MHNKEHAISIPAKHRVVSILTACLLLPIMAFGQVEDSSWTGTPGESSLEVMQRPADSLRFYIEGARVFITSLPDSLNGKSVERYEPIRLPAWSWLRGKSFVWRMEYDNTGSYEVDVAAVVDGQVADTLRFVLVYTEPEDATE